MKTHLEELLSGYMDGQLDAAQRARVEQHLGECAACRAELEELRQVKSTVLAACPMPTMEITPAFFWSQVKRGIEAEERKETRPAQTDRAEGFSWARLRWVLVSAASVLVVAFLVGVGLLGGFGRRPAQAMFVEIQEVSTKVPNVTVASFKSSTAGVSVIWVSGLEPIAEDVNDL